MTQDIVELLTKWADVLEIPSGGFVNEDLRRAASVITTMTAERDAYKLSAEYESGDPDAADRIRRIIAKAEASRALVQSMREALEPFANGSVDVSGTAIILDSVEAMSKAKRAARAALSRSEV